MIAGLTVSFRLEVFSGLHLPEHDYALALYHGGLSVARTQTYRPMGEVTGQGYRAGGESAGGYTLASVGEIVTLDWTLPEWPVTTISATQALLYNRSLGGNSVAVLDFGQEYSSTNGPFRLDVSAPLVRWR
jgi:hypothetical protein